jgi:signal transduction histidine kinase
MLRALRWKLTFLYLFIAISLVAFMGLGTYLLIQRYFQQTTDLALQVKMAGQFRTLGLELPSELARAENLWLKNNSQALPPSPTPTRVKISNESDDDSNDSESDGKASDGENKGGEYSYEADLAAVFALPLNADGSPMLSSPISPPIVNDAAVLNSALDSGYDLRTVDQPNTGRLRVLTYRTGLASPALLQTGRLLGDQERALAQYILFLIILGGSAAIFLAFASYWLAGRSLGPAQKAWDQQQTFVSNASHELRTPLTLIRATADYGLRTKSPDEKQALLQDIVQECDYMDSLVDDLLLLSRLDAQRLKLELQPVPLAGLFAETLRQVNKLAQDRNISILTGPDAGRVLADAARLRQVLLILLDNALRFTPSGGSIRISAQARGKMIRIEIADTGKGIERQHLAHLFDRFYQVPSAENDASRSNGLGLSIAKSLTEAQNGSIHIESAPGKGTVVSLLLHSG